jgi:hypothetical protein
VIHSDNGPEFYRQSDARTIVVCDTTTSRSAHGNEIAVLGLPELAWNWELAERGIRTPPQLTDFVACLLLREFRYLQS